MSVIARDLPCDDCSYNLRGLADDGACPECGCDVAATLRGITPARAAWLRRVSWGALLVGAGIVVGGAGVAPTVEWREPWVLYAFPAGAIVAGAGTWLLASPRRRQALGATDVIVRAAGTATCAMQLLATLAVAAAMGYLTTPPAVPASTVYLIGQSAAVVWAVAALLTCARAARLARGINDRAGAVQAWMLAVLGAIALVGGAAIWRQDPGVYENMRTAHLIMSAVVAGWSVVFFAGFAFVLRRRSAAAPVGAAFSV